MSLVRTWVHLVPGSYWDPTQDPAGSKVDPVWIQVASILLLWISGPFVPRCWCSVSTFWIGCNYLQLWLSSGHFHESFSDWVHTVGHMKTSTLTLSPFLSHRYLGCAEIHTGKTFCFWHVYYHQWATYCYFWVAEELFFFSLKIRMCDALLRRAVMLQIKPDTVKG